MTLVWLRRILLISLELMGAMLAGALVLGLLLAWRLGQGPVPLDAVRVYLTASLGQVMAPLQVSFESAMLDWGGAQGAGFGFVLRQVRLTSADGATVATVPEMDVGFSVPGLLIGRLTPSRVRLSGARLRLVRTQEGVVQLSLASPTASALPDDSDPAAEMLDLLTTLAQPVGAKGVLGSLRQFAIHAAQVDVVDYRYGVRWLMPRADFLLQRDRAGMRGGVRLEAALGSQTPVVAGAFLLRRNTGDLVFSLGVDRFNPAKLAPWSPSFAELARLDVPLGGQVRGRWALPNGISHLDFDLTVGKGVVLAQTDQPPLGVTYGQLRGRIDRQNRRLDVSNLYLDFDGPKLSGAASLVREGNTARLSLTSTIEAMPAAHLARYWLPGWAPGARDWVVSNITDGRVPKAEAQVQVNIPLADPGKAAPVSLAGSMTLEDLTVHYFKPLPPATQANGLARFDLDGFHITVDRATVGALTVGDGTVNLLGLNDHGERADIEITVRGKLADQLLLLDREPLRYPRRLGLEAAKAGGEAVTRARFQFPLFKDLPRADVAVAAISTARNVSLPTVVMGQNLTGGALDLVLDGGGMTITGSGRIGPAPATFTWMESFLDDVSPGTRIAFKGAMDETARQAFRLSWPEVVGDTVAVEGVYTKDPGQPATLEAALDLTPARLTLPWFAWEKPVGTAARGSVTVTVDRNQVTRIPAFRVTGPEAELRGQVAFGAQSAWRTVTFDKLTLPSTVLRGSVTKQGDAGGLTLDFSGSSADVRGVFADKPEGAPAVPAEAAAPVLLPLDIRFDVGRAVTGDGLSLAQAKGRVVRNTRGWTQLEVAGTLGASAIPLSLHLLPTPTGRSLTIETDDAGAMLATLGLMKNIRGGKLRVTGQGAGNGPVDAVADLRDFRYLQPETLQRLAREAKPEGADALAREEGLLFSRLKADVRYSEDTLEIRKARLAGDMLGLSFAGPVDLLRGRLDLSGTLVPLYGLNAIVGNVPLIGWLLTGGEGGGLFAATYRVKGTFDDPETSVNPLSILAPGFLRELFFVDRH